MPTICPGHFPSGRRSCCIGPLCRAAPVRSPKSWPASSRGVRSKSGCPRMRRCNARSRRRPEIRDHRTPEGRRRTSWKPIRSAFFGWPPGGSRGTKRWRTGQSRHPVCGPTSPRLYHSFPERSAHPLASVMRAAAEKEGAKQALYFAIDDEVGGWSSAVREQLQNRQQPFEFHGRDLPSVLIELGTLVAQEKVEDMLAKGFRGQIRAFHGADGLVEVAGQRGNPQGLPLAFSQRPDIILRTLGQLVFTLDPRQPGCEHQGKGEIGIAGRIDRAQFDTRR